MGILQTEKSHSSLLSFILPQTTALSFSVLVFIFVCLVATPSKAQVLLLALHPEIILGGA